MRLCVCVCFVCKYVDIYVCACIFMYWTYLCIKYPGLILVQNICRITLPEVSGRITLPEVSGRITLPEVSGRITLPEVSGRITLPEGALEG